MLRKRTNRFVVSYIHYYQQNNAYCEKKRKPKKHLTNTVANKKRSPIVANCIISLLLLLPLFPCIVDDYIRSLCVCVCRYGRLPLLIESVRMILLTIPFICILYECSSKKENENHLTKNFNI